MKLRFSQRIGKTPMQETIQIDTMTESFKNRLFNLVSRVLENQFSEDSPYIEPDFLYEYNQHFSHLHDNNDNLYEDFIRGIYAGVYHEDDIWFFYDLIAFIIGNFKLYNKEKIVVEFNEIFKIEKSAYRFDNSYELVKISDKIELDEINTAIEKTSKYEGVEKHLKNARNFFSDRRKPNYNKTISESVDAVESLCKIITKNDQATLGKAAQKIQGLHSKLKDSILNLYKYASDESGIRHGHKKSTTNIDEHTAKFILVSCHSIVNYLIAKNLGTN